MINSSLAFTIHDTSFSTSVGTEIEQKNFVGPVSTIMRLITQRDWDLSTYFDIIDASELGINI